MITDSMRMAELLFPDTTLTPCELESRYPSRNLTGGANVTRFAPSPTGFLHIGGLFTALISKRLADQSDGTFYLRIEDTDKKREVENGVTNIIRFLADFDMTCDEGVAESGEEYGQYGPYRQSDRGELYKVYAKHLVQQQLAYPCFCSEQELDELRKTQEALKLRPGYYGEWAKHRNLSYAEASAYLDEGRPFVLRLRSEGGADDTIAFTDLIKGGVEMPRNDQDIVLIKSDGLPTYHFAHAVDDYLMRTTHVIRGDEWLSSMPIHLQLYEVLGFPAPAYAHIAPIGKMDGASKRKLSKRKDPEAAVSYYKEIGIPQESVTEYLLGLANWDFEDWRQEHPAAPHSEFQLDLNKMNTSGALFDFGKLADISKNIISQMDAEEVYRRSLEWAHPYDSDLAQRLESDPAYAAAIFGIERGGGNARKDIAKWSDIRDYVSFFYDEWFTQTEQDPLPASIPPDDAAAMAEAYVQMYNRAEDKQEWFSRIQKLAEKYGYAAEVKQFKKNPGVYKGHVGDVSLLLRVILTGRRKTPDLCEVMRVMGEERVMMRFTQWLQNRQ